jgi:hypothetical protein
MVLSNRFPIVMMIFGSLLASCSESKKAPPPQAEVEALLKQRAETEKREAEADVNPKLGVKVTWTIQGVEVRPQPANEKEPYLGTIKFLIESQTPELDGVATERLERSYEYVWDPATGAWSPKY